MQFLVAQWVFQKQEYLDLYDLIGIDLMADVLKSFIKELPQKMIHFIVVAKEIPLITKLIQTGYTGRKGKGGFYRMNKAK